MAIYLTQCKAERKTIGNFMQRDVQNCESKEDGQN